jgi:hypothetical protein
LRPTHLIAWLRVLEPARFLSFGGLTPRESLRLPAENFPSPFESIVGNPKI